MSGLGGATAVAFASGFLNPADDQPAFGVFAAPPDGTVLELPSVEQDCAGSWGGASSVDERGVCDGSGIADGACDCDGTLPQDNFDCEGNCLVEVDCLECLWWKCSS